MGGAGAGCCCCDGALLLRTGEDLLDSVSRLRRDEFDYGSMTLYLFVCMNGAIRLCIGCACVSILQHIIELYSIFTSLVGSRRRQRNVERARKVAQRHVNGSQQRHAVLLCGLRKSKLALARDQNLFAVCSNHDNLAADPCPLTNKTKTADSNGQNHKISSSREAIPAARGSDRTCPSNRSNRPSKPGAKCLGLQNAKRVSDDGTLQKTK